MPLALSSHPARLSGVISWGLIVPVKRLELAKTRLTGFTPSARADLALAFAADVVCAVLACPLVQHVLVVTDDERAAAALAALGAEVVGDRPDSGLNPALAHGAALVRERDAQCGVATASSDLASLRPQDLAVVLAALSPGGRGFVGDMAGTGTTVLGAAPGADLAPSFGPGSWRRHSDSGAMELTAPQTVHLDVDTPDDLVLAMALGVGTHTRGVLRDLR